MPPSYQTFYAQKTNRTQTIDICGVSYSTLYSCVTSNVLNPHPKAPMDLHNQAEPVSGILDQLKTPDVANQGHFQ